MLSFASYKCSLCTGPRSRLLPTGRRGTAHRTRCYRRSRKCIRRNCRMLGQDVAAQHRLLDRARTALKAVCQAHEPIRYWLTIAKSAATFYRHTHGVSIVGACEQRQVKVAPIVPNEEKVICPAKYDSMEGNSLEAKKPRPARGGRTPF